MGVVEATASRGRDTAVFGKLVALARNCSDVSPGVYSSYQTRAWAVLGSTTKATTKRANRALIHWNIHFLLLLDLSSCCRFVTVPITRTVYHKVNL